MIGIAGFVLLVIISLGGLAFTTISIISKSKKTTHPELFEFLVMIGVIILLITVYIIGIAAGKGINPWEL